MVVMRSSKACFILCGWLWLWRNNKSDDEECEEWIVIDEIFLNWTLWLLAKSHSIRLRLFILKVFNEIDVWIGLNQLQTVSAGEESFYETTEFELLSRRVDWLIIGFDQAFNIYYRKEFVLWNERVDVIKLDLEGLLKRSSWIDFDWFWREFILLLYEPGDEE